MNIDDEIFKQLLHHVPAGDESPEFWYRSVAEENGGYYMFWGNGEHLHTYHYPPNLRK